MPLISIQQNGVHETKIIDNSTPSPLSKMSSASVASTAVTATAPLAPAAQRPLHNIQPNSQFNARPLAQQSGALPPLTSNGYVTHDAIIGKVRLHFHYFHSIFKIMFI